MKNAKIIMANGKEYYCENLGLEKVINMVTNDDGTFKERSIVLTGESMVNKIMINPKQIASIEECE